MGALLSVAHNLTRHVMVRALCFSYTNGYVAACVGDSGGPLQCLDEHGRWKLVGVVSFVSSGCIRPELPAVYTRVSTYNRWITNELSESNSCRLNTALPLPHWVSFNLYDVIILIIPTCLPLFSTHIPLLRFFSVIYTSDPFLIHSLFPLFRILFIVILPLIILYHLP